MAWKSFEEMTLAAVDRREWRLWMRVLGHFLEEQVVCVVSRAVSLLVGRTAAGGI